MKQLIGMTALAAVWLGATMNCCTCHDHKFDPISQKDFYAMSAFFNNTSQGAMDGNIPNTPPTIFVPRTEDRPRWDVLAKEIGGLRAHEGVQEHVTDDVTGHSPGRLRRELAAGTDGSGPLSSVRGHSRGLPDPRPMTKDK